MSENKLIDGLAPMARAGILKICERVSLSLGDVLCESGTPMPFAYFPATGFISLITVLDAKPVLEVGMVGREGMLGANLALGMSETPLRALVQGNGSAWRIEAGSFRKEIARNNALNEVLSRYIYVLMAQLATSAACLRFHPIGPRLARWLLMTQDRALTNEFRVTHEFLAYMLGVRRVGITNAAGLLQDQGLIEYRRGDLTVLDRRGLKLAACECYRNDNAIYARAFA